MDISYSALISNIYKRDLGNCRYHVRIVYDLIGLYGHLVVRSMRRGCFKFCLRLVNKLKLDKKM